MTYVVLSSPLGVLANVVTTRVEPQAPTLFALRARCWPTVEQDRRARALAWPAEQHDEQTINEGEAS